MTATEIAREAQWAEQNGAIQGFFLDLIGMVALTIPAKPSRFPAAVASHPAFTQRFNARLVAVGMAATNGHRRLGG